MAASLQSWQTFFLSRGNLLRRGHAGWPANRTLLQLAMEADPDSLQAGEAERWIRESGFDGLWLRSPRRRQDAAGRAPNVVLEFDEGVDGVLELTSGRLASWSDSHLRLWDLGTGALDHVLELSGRIDAVHQLGSRSPLAVVAQASSDGREFRLWNTESKQLGPLCGDSPGAARVVGSPVFLTSGGFAAEAEGPTGPSVAVWDSGGRFVSAYDAYRKRIWGITPVEGMVLAIHGDDRAVHVWDWSTGESTLLAGHRKGLRQLLVLPGGRVMTASLDSTLRLWDLHSSSCLAVFEGLDRLPCAQVVDRVSVIASSSGHDIGIWGLEGGPATAVLAGHTATVGGVLRSGPDHLLSWAANHEIRLWNTRDAVCEQVWKEKRIRGCAILDERRAITWSAEGRIRVWEVGHDKAVAQLRVTPELRDVEIDPDGGIRFADGDNRRLRWVPGDGEPEVLFATDPGEWLLELSDGRHVTRTDQRLKIGPPLTPGGPASVTQAESGTAGPVGSWVRDGLAFVDRRTGQVVHEISGKLLHELSDGRLLVARTNARIVVDGATGAELGRLRGPKGPVQGPFVLGDGRWLTFSAAEQEARIWDPETLACDHRFAVRPQTLRGDGIPIRMGAAPRQPELSS